MKIQEERNSIPRKSCSRQKKSGGWGPRFAVLIIIAIGFLFLWVGSIDTQSGESTEKAVTSVKSSEEINAENDYITFDENGDPTPESIERILASERMEQYDRALLEEVQEEMKEEQEHMMNHPEGDIDMDHPCY